MQDTYGKGLKAFFHGRTDSAFLVESDIIETEEWPISLFFRAYDEMPKIEKTALSRVKGSVLDVGAGAGSHALWLQEQNNPVTTIDISSGAVEVMKARGVKRALKKDFFSYTGEKFDTLLLLMNGIGITGKLERLPAFLEQAKQLLNPHGKILLDSSDIIYLFTDEEDCVIDEFDTAYYGEISYCFHFEKEQGHFFDWLFIDFDTLKDYAERSGFSCKKIEEDDHFLYLAELTLK